MVYSKTNNQTKTAKCVDCGKEEAVSKFATFPVGYRCKDCKKKREIQLAKEKSKINFPGPHYCKTCGKEITEEFRTDPHSIRNIPPRFCCRECANAYSSSFTKGKTKTAICTVCGKEEEVNIHTTTTNYKCKECREKKYIKYNKVKDSSTNSIKKVKKEKYKVLPKVKLFEDIDTGAVLKLTLKEFTEYRKKLNLTTYQYYNILAQKEAKNEDFNLRIEIFKNSNAFLLQGRALTNLGFDFKNLNVEEEYFKTRNLLITEYLVNKKPVDQIEKEYNLGQGTLSPKFFYWFGVKKRSISESILNAVETGNLKLNIEPLLKASMNLPSFPYKDEHHTDWQGNDFYLKSTYETELANLLDEYHINYTVNKFSIKYFDSQLNKERIGYPDFYLPDYNLCIETKSNYFYDPVNLEDRRKVLEKEGIRLYILLDKKILLKGKFPSYEDIKKKKYIDGRKELRKIFSNT